MRVVHIISSLATGGAEMMLKRLIESAPATFPRTVVVSLTALGPIGEALRAHGVSVHALGMSSLLDSPITLWRLVRLIRRYQPEIVQTWMYHADLLGGLAARLAGCRAVVWGIRSTAIPQGALSVTYWLVRLCAICSHTIPHRIICCAKSAKEAHLKLGYAARKMVVIPNGYDFSAFDHHSNSRAAARHELKFDDNEIVIGAVGRFDALKDFHNFVDATFRLSAKRPDVKYLMLGRNIEWTNTTLRGWIEDAGLLNHFKLLGEQHDVPYFLSAMDVFCLSSTSEAFPNVVVEAMAMGLPCVVTRAGDAADILDADNFVVPIKDSDSLFDALLRMCELDADARRTLGAANAVRVRGEYGIEEIRREYEAIYAESISQMTKIQTNNSDPKTVEGFGDEWSRFDQSAMSDEDSNKFFEGYFSIFPWADLPKNAVGFDLGCGSGRWAKLVAPRVGRLHCIDPSVAIEVARKNIGQNANCEFHQAGVDDIPLRDRSMDFGYSLGVLHHIPDTYAALVACVTKLKPGAPFLLYLYYAFDNRPVWFRVLWRVSDGLRKGISRMPHGLRYAMSQVIAGGVYWPLARAARLAEASGINVTNFPLSSYRDCGFYVMRTDALDRFGTRLEQRFTRTEIKAMMESAGLENIRFSEALPFWCAIGYAKATVCAA